MLPRDLERRLSDLIAFQCVLVALRGAGRDATEEMLWQTFLWSLVLEYGFARAWYGRRVATGLQPVVAVPVRAPGVDDLPADISEDSPFLRTADLALPVSVEGCAEGMVVVFGGGEPESNRTSQIGILTGEVAAMLAERRARVRRDQELAAAQRQLIKLSREAGMAEIATSVLHNVGNVLNSVNVSTSLVAGKVRESRVDNLVALIHMLEQHNGSLPEFLAKDPKGQRVLPYLAKLGGHLQSERDGLLKELDLLSSHVGHIKQIVATQQNYAKVSGLVENIRLSEVVDDALRILEVGLVRHEIKLEREFEILPTIAADKHQILQILLNLLRNAKDAIKQADGERGKVIRVSIRRRGKSRVSLAVEDTGVGLPPENLTRIFGHGFTTKADGHGFGLHSCALAASQMGGSLRAKSEGLGRGATFILELPLRTGEEFTSQGPRPV
jgi:signal transduction histidine kinase